MWQLWWSHSKTSSEWCAGQGIVRQISRKRPNKKEKALGTNTNRIWIISNKSNRPSTMRKKTTLTSWTRRTKLSKASNNFRPTPSSKINRTNSLNLIHGFPRSSGKIWIEMRTTLIVLGPHQESVPNILTSSLDTRVTINMNPVSQVTRSASSTSSQCKVRSS